MKYSMAALLALAGCDTTPAAEPATDAGVQLDGMVIGDDAGPIDAAAPDATPPDMGVTCAPSAVTLPVDPAGPDTQIHPAIAVDGDGLWVVYNRVTPGESTFDVWATRLGCDGLPTIAPFEVTADRVSNDVDPGVAVGPAGVIFAWTQNLDNADPNLVTRYRIFEHDGAPRGPSIPLITQREGADFADGHWMPQVAATPDGFVIVGARGVEARSAFQVYGHRLNADGEPIGETASVELDMTQQLDPDVGIAADGTVWIAWGEGDQGNGAVVAAPWTDDPALVTQPAFPAPSGSTRITAGTQSFVLGHVEKRGGTDILVRQLDGEARFEVGGMGAIDIQPAMAVQPGEAGEDGALMAWFRRIQGNRAAVWTQRLDLSDGLVAVGDPVEIELVDPAAPYPMAVAALADGRYAISWTEGVAPAYRVMVRFVEP
ncbi:MAG: hypothetical protein ACI9U2_001624 [Bradymonadia bacterium]|jgi:hypothetical protein